MKFRKLRIAWSVWWGVAILVLIAVWTQAGAVYLSGYFPGVSSFGITSWCFLDSIWTDTVSVLVSFGWNADSDAQWEIGRVSNLGGGLPQGFHIAIEPDPPGLTAYLPHWCLALLLVSFAILPWMPAVYRPQRFSLRTLLIATTLVALALGVIMWTTS